MNTSLVNTGRMLWAALRMLLVLTVVTVVIHPLVVTGVGQTLFHDKANGSMVEAAKKQVAAFNGVCESQVPKDAVTGSASAIDPDISRQYADIQVKRVAKANGLPPRRCRSWSATTPGAAPSASSTSLASTSWSSTSR